MSASTFSILLHRMLGMSANDGAELIVGQPEAPVVRIPTEQESPFLTMVWVHGARGGNIPVTDAGLSAKFRRFGLK